MDPGSTQDPISWPLVYLAARQSAGSLSIVRASKRRTKLGATSILEIPGKKACFHGESYSTKDWERFGNHLGSEWESFGKVWESLGSNWEGLGGGGVTTKYAKQTKVRTGATESH
jgi:hypothetical protein